MRSDSNTRFLRRPRIILILTIFAVIGDFALWYWVEKFASARTTLPIPRAGAAVPVRVTISERPDLPIYAIGAAQASFTIGINSQLDGIVQDVLTNGQLLVNTPARILPSSARTEAAK